MKRYYNASFLALCYMILLTTTIAFAAAPVSGQDFGSSYLRINVNSEAAQNFVSNPAYNGWMQILDVRARRPLAARPTSSVLSNRRVTVAYGPWTDFSKIMRTGEIGAGRLEFGAGDDGQLEPLLTAQQKKILIPDAVLDFYTEDQNRVVGEFEIKGIRILSLRDVPASACPMYEITISFHSIVKK